MITKEQVQHIAKLARIELAEEEMQKFQKDLSEILEYFEILKKADTSLVEEIEYSAAVPNTAREDVPQKAGQELAAALFRMAPAKEREFVKVPKVLPKGKQ